MERFANRWKAIKKSRANLALVIIGCVLVLSSPFWRFVVAPAIKVVATDFDQLYFYQGDLVTYVNPPGLPSLPSDEPAATPISLEQWIFSRPDLSTPGISTVQESIELTSLEDGEVLVEDERMFTLDRDTGENTESADADRDRSGYYIVFPFDTPRDDVPVWSEQTGKTYEAAFEGETDVEGLNAYRFSLTYENEPIDRPYRYPAELTGLELKDLLSMPELALDDSETIRPEYVATGEQLLEVEPRMGTIIYRSLAESVSLSIEKPESGVSVTRLLYNIQYATYESSVLQAVQFAKDEISKLSLQYTYIPLGFLLFGIVCLLTGTFAGTKAIQKGLVNSSREPGAETTVAEIPEPEESVPAERSGEPGRGDNGTD